MVRAIVPLRGIAFSVLVLAGDAFSHNSDLDVGAEIRNAIHDVLATGPR